MINEAESRFDGQFRLMFYQFFNSVMISIFELYCERSSPDFWSLLLQDADFTVLRISSLTLNPPLVPTV